MRKLRIVDRVAAVRLMAEEYRKIQDTGEKVLNFIRVAEEMRDAINKKLRVKTLYTDMLSIDELARRFDVSISEVMRRLTDEDLAKLTGQRHVATEITKKLGEALDLGKCTREEAWRLLSEELARHEVEEETEEKI